MSRVPFLLRHLNEFAHTDYVKTAYYVIKGANRLNKTLNSHTVVSVRVYNHLLPVVLK